MTWFSLQTYCPYLIGTSLEVDIFFSDISFLYIPTKLPALVHNLELSLDKKRTERTHIVWLSFSSKIYKNETVLFVSSFVSRTSMLEEVYNFRGFPRNTQSLVCNKQALIFIKPFFLSKQTCNKLPSHNNIENSLWIENIVLTSFLSKIISDSNDLHQAFLHLHQGNNTFEHMHY